MAFDRRRLHALYSHPDDHALWGYESDTDSIATISASGYFDAAVAEIAARDLLFVFAADTSGIRYVSSALGALPITLANPGGVEPEEGDALLIEGTTDALLIEGTSDKLLLEV